MDLSQLSNKHKAALDEFKRRVSDVLLPEHSDEYLALFLKANKFSKHKTEPKFRKSVEWQKKHEELLKEWKPPLVLEEPLAKAVSGHDKEGCPFNIMNVGRIDVKGLLKSISDEDVEMTVAYTIEILKQDAKVQGEKLGREILQLTSILDLEGLELKTAMVKRARDIFIVVAKLITENFPESLKKIFIINAPSFFPFIYNMVKPFIGKEIQRKVVVFGSDRSKWVPALFEYIDADQLPKHWGGNLVDPDGDPHCPSKIWMGGEVPKSFYLANAANIPDSDFEPKNIEKGQSLDLEFDVTIANSKLLWVFYLEKPEEKIGFVVRHKSASGDKEVVPYTREKRDDMVNGEFLCCSTGKYVVTFDNSQGKKNMSVFYFIEVIPPEETEEQQDSD